MTDHPLLLSPLRVGALTLPNRVVMGAMHTRLETLDRPLERLAAFYARRAEGGAALILTGGHAPVPEGVIDDGGLVLEGSEQLGDHRRITQAVRDAGGQVALQILHAGRYAKRAGCVAPSEGQARINRFAPRALSTDEVWATIDAYARTAALAREAGYAGVEVMGSEGYLISQFTTALTNRRDDEFGGSLDARLRFPVEIVKAVRRRAGNDCLLIYRISALDLMDGGMTADETAELARRVQAAGADLINTGIGWHESAVPTIAAAVPRAAWSAAVRQVKQAVQVPVMASNRINTPAVAEALLADGTADLVSMARPLLADPDFVRKVAAGRADEIASCIACNQACLDHIFTERTATCLVNPRAGRELDFVDAPAAASRRVAVVGGGPAGMACALEAARRGHAVTLFESAPVLGGQLQLARRVPGKAEFDETLRHYAVTLPRAGVTLRLGRPATVDELTGGAFDDVVLATGVRPRRPAIPGIEHAKVVGYADVLSGRVTVGARVAIIGAGGIGFDVADYLVSDAAEATDAPAFMRAWGVDPGGRTPGGLVPAAAPAPRRQVHLLQRQPGTPGRGLGKSTGWILKARLRQAGVTMTGGVSYERIDDEGLHVRVDGQPRLLAVDHVVLCAGQESERGLADGLRARGVEPRLIGGAERAEALDALRAIEQATRLALAL
ncbi:MAG: NADPH-dependent 2,4-dienoyl-CoA reductase [Rubrivivax sp.]